MILIIPVLLLLRLFMWRIFPQFGTSYMSDTVFAFICVLAFTFYEIWRCKSRFAWPMLFLLAGSTLAASRSTFLLQSVFGTFALALMMLVFVYIFRKVRVKEDISWIWSFVIVAAILSAGQGLREFYILRYIPLHENASHALQIIHESKRSCSFQGWPTIFAGFLILVIPSLYFSFMAAWGRRKYVLGFLLVFLLLGLGSSLSFLPLVSLCLAMLITTNIKRAQFILYPIIVLLAIVWSTKAVDSFFTARIAYLVEAKNMVIRHPFIGSGLGTFYSYGKYGFTRSTFAHNTYIQFWAEAGLMGFIGILGLTYTFWMMKPSEDLLEKSIFTGLLAVFIDNMFSFTMIKPNLAFVWWVSLALYAKLHYINRRLS